MLDLAQGEYVARMDADDIALPLRLEQQVAFLEANPDHFAVGSQFLVIDPWGYPLRICGENERTHEEIEALQLDGRCGSVIAHSAVTYRREPVLAIGKYETKYYFGDDLDLFFRLTEHGGRQANLPQVLMKIRVHAKSVIHKDRLLQDQTIWEIARAARKRRGLPDLPHAIFEAFLTMAEPLEPLDYSRMWGWWALASGYRATARRHGWDSVTKSPWSKESCALLYCAVRGY